MLFVKEIELF